MAITSFDDIISGYNAGYNAQDTFYMQTAATTSTLFTGHNMVRQNYTTKFLALPSVPGGKSYFIPTNIEVSVSNARTIQIVELTSFGSIDISGASGTFTDGSAAPTVTEGGTSRQIPSAVLAVVTTVLNATPGTLTITYKDQDNNAAETTAAITLTASAAVGTAGFIPLNSPDWGAVDITAATRAAGTTPTGVITFYHVRPVCTLIQRTPASLVSANFLTDLARIVKLAAGEQLGILGVGTTTNGLQGRINYLAV